MHSWMESIKDIMLGDEHASFFSLYTILVGAKRLVISRLVCAKCENETFLLRQNL